MKSKSLILVTSMPLLYGIARYYYQYRTSRLPTCPLTIHALLHMPFYIRRTGPLWASWAFVMERFCGHLLPAVKNRVRPYEHLDYYVQRRAQMQIVSQVLALPSLAKPSVNYRYQNGVEMSSHETAYEECKCFFHSQIIIYHDTDKFHQFPMLC